ncbi:MAG TPA: hypothetical protein VFT56_02080 [Sphingomonas sp.]|nr:hypothetical protein [Sphingomonas sp.]
MTLSVGGVPRRPRPLDWLPVLRRFACGVRMGCRWPVDPRRLLPRMTGGLHTGPCRMPRLRCARLGPSVKLNLVPCLGSRMAPDLRLRLRLMMSLGLLARRCPTLAIDAGAGFVPPLFGAGVGCLRDARSVASTARLLRVVPGADARCFCDRRFPPGVSAGVRGRLPACLHLPGTPLGDRLRTSPILLYLPSFPSILHSLAFLVPGALVLRHSLHRTLGLALFGARDLPRLPAFGASASIDLLPALGFDKAAPVGLGAGSLRMTPFGGVVAIKVRRRAVLAAAAPDGVARGRLLPDALLVAPVARLLLGSATAFDVPRGDRAAPAIDGSAPMIPLPRRNTVMLPVARGGIERAGTGIIARRGNPLTPRAVERQRAAVDTIDRNQGIVGIGIAVIGIADVIRIVRAGRVVIITIAVVDRFDEGLVAVGRLPGPRFHAIRVIEIIIGRRFADHLVDRVGAIDIGIIGAAGGRCEAKRRGNGKLGCRRGDGHRPDGRVAQRYGGRQRRQLRAGCS